MADPAGTPPMAEILASIRRIMVEDPPLVPSRPEGGEPEHAGDLPGDPDDGDDEVLELGAPPAPSPAASSSVSDPILPLRTDALVSETAEAASQKALAALAGVTIDPAAGADTLDGLVREMLRPLVKAWLDANLPDLVERIVTREVARITGR